MAARHVLVVADSCYAATLSQSSTGRPEPGSGASELVKTVEGLASRRARMVMTSGGIEPVADAAGGAHSAFAQVFVDTLKTSESTLLGRDLFGRLQVRVNDLAQRWAISQVPEYAPIKYAGHEGGDFFFVRRAPDRSWRAADSARARTRAPAEPVPGEHGPAGTAGGAGVPPARPAPPGSTDDRVRWANGYGQTPGPERGLHPPRPRPVPRVRWDGRPQGGRGGVEARSGGDCELRGALGTRPGDHLALRVRRRAEPRRQSSPHRVQARQSRGVPPRGILGRVHAGWAPPWPRSSRGPASRG